MIFYFSGTGNSLAVAKEIGTVQEEKLVSIAKEMVDKEKFEYFLEKDESVFFIFPIYAWAPPLNVIKFIENLTFHGYKNQYVSCVVTCGENIGNTMNLVRQTLMARDIHLNSGFSIEMPNNYMMFGDVEPSEKIRPKIDVSKQTLSRVNELIHTKTTDIYEVVLGPMPRFLTTVVNPLFQRYATDEKQFFATDDCIGCKICERVCNGQCIEVSEKPTWSKGCTQCLACINYCPKSAIQYGKRTSKKGRYVNPEIRVHDMFVR